MYYIEIKLASGNWVTIAGRKTFAEAERYANMYCSNSQWKIYEK